MNVDVFKKTSDDWHPSYRVNCWWGDTLFVHVGFAQPEPYPEPPCNWIVTVSGMGNDILVKEFEYETEAWVCFLQVIGMEDVTRESVINLGFKG